MGCSQSDTSDQTAERREKRIAQTSGENSTMHSDETVSTAHNDGNRQAAATTLTKNVLSKAKAEEKQSLAKQSILRQNREGDRSPSAQQQPGNTSNTNNTSNDLQSDIPVDHNLPSPRGTGRGSNHSSPTSRNPLANPARNHVRMEPGCYSEEGDDDKSVMGDVEMSSQVGRGSTTESNDSDSPASQRHNSSNNLSSRPVTSPTVAIPSTYLPGGNRARRINAWIDGTKAFQVVQIQKGAKRKMLSTGSSGSNGFVVSHTSGKTGNIPNPNRVGLGKSPNKFDEPLVVEDHDDDDDDDLQSRESSSRSQPAAMSEVSGSGSGSIIPGVSRSERLSRLKRQNLRMDADLDSSDDFDDDDY